MADELFKIITSAGMQCGMTIRPQNLTINPDWKPSQRPNQPPFKYMQQDHLMPDQDCEKYGPTAGKDCSVAGGIELDIDATAEVLIRKARYAYQRWKCTFFYVDTTVYRNGHLIPAEVFIKANAAIPEVVFFPEESDFAYRSVTAPLSNNWNGAADGTPLGADVLWGRDAFSLELMQFSPDAGNEGPKHHLDPNHPYYANETLLKQYETIVARGDTLIISPVSEAT